MRLVYADDEKGHFIGVDPGSLNGDMSCVVLGKKNQDGTIIINNIIYGPSPAWEAFKALYRLDLTLEQMQLRILEMKEKGL